MTDSDPSLRGYTGAHFCIDTSNISGLKGGGGGGGGTHKHTHTHSLIEDSSYIIHAAKIS